MARRNVTRGAPPRIARSWGTRTSKGGTGGARGDDGESTLGTYFREMAESNVMSAEEEARAARSIARRRAEYWRALLMYPPYCEAILDFMLENLDDEDAADPELSRHVGELRRSVRRLRKRRTKANEDAFGVAASKVALAVSYMDTDSLISDQVAADLDTLEAGYRYGISLDVRPPRRGSRPFRDFVTRVRQAQAALRAEKHAFVRKNLRLVVSIARRFNHGKLPLSDLIQEGNIGLMKAVDRFDHRRGFRFSTYGSWWIRHAISRAIADKGREIRLPVHMLDAHQRLVRARRELEHRLGREPSMEEIAAHAKVPKSKVEKLDPAVLDPPVSLERMVSGDDDRKVADFLEDDRTPLPSERIEAEDMHDQVRKIIRQLRPIEADILRKRFGLASDEDGLTLKEIGRHYQLSRERIRQIQEQALIKLRRELERREAT
ncbi:MAG: sigma-70 family RNA polymerase sigma factor [Deltaproteobacteria bacterium]|nr:MAG: sigma-70 family RNA polymerase sigma factor [Deltaproteobacteria bacterium]